MIPQPLRIGSRDSLLAVMQTNLIIKKLKKLYPDATIELVTLKTTGDLILDRTLDKIGGKGLFVKELDLALLEGRIDLAVHSLKDLPMEENPDLPIVAYAERGEVRDVLVLPKSRPEAPMTKNIGTSSMRRQLQLKKLYHHATISPIRGNIVTRLSKLDNGDFSALILAGAGLIRADLSDRISRYFTTEEMVPAAGQGTLVIQARHDLDCEFLEPLCHTATRYSALAERAFVRTLDGGCSSPIAAYAQVYQREIQLTGLHYNPHTQEHIILTQQGTFGRVEQLGEQLALACRREIGE